MNSNKKTMDQNARSASRNARLMSKNNLSIPKLIPAYPGQVCKMFKVLGTPTTLQTTTVSGVIASAISFQASSVQNFATRFGALFEEYRIVRVAVSAKCYSQSNPGLLVHWIDEKQTAAPTSAEALQKSDKTFQASSPSPHTIKWTARDPLDLQYTDIGTINVQVATYKVYTDFTNFGSSGTVTPYLAVVPEYWIQFRGLN
jgi:hypothetical protein